MKKQFQILAATFITVAFISCSRERIEAPPTIISEEIATAKGGNISSFNPAKGLEFWFPFNGNIKEGNGKPIDAVATTNGADIYTEDRFGTANSAIKFNGRYGLTLTGMGLATNMSVSAWVRYDSVNVPGFYFLSAPLSLGQQNDTYIGAISTPTTTGVISNPVDDHWHHLVATYDGSHVRFYVDGVFVGDHFNPGSFNSGPAYGGATMWVSNFANQFWHGTMDELRFYTRTLSAKDVQALYQL